MACSVQAMEIAEVSKVETLRLKAPIVIEPGLTRWQISSDKDFLRILSGSRFPVSLLSRLDSATATVGDPVKAMLLTSIQSGTGENRQTLVAQGAILSGWISDVYHSRKALSSQFSPTRWSNANAAIRIHFDQLTCSGGRIIRLKAEPAIGTGLSGTTAEFDFAVNKRGEISFDFGRGKYTAASVAIGAASFATGPLSIVVGPTLSGAAGAIDPAYALDRPVSETDDHAKVKGLFQGMIKGLPGGSFLLGARHEGLAVDVNPGAQLYLELTEDLILPGPAAAKSSASLL